ncbi:hypothetical protein AB0F20_09775 [Streptomyces goshikiensis]|uniref:hypothetical protein n=1 Tax=Streptomyces goshikiensis TaxID=1942 RepID=UPI0034046FBC
MDQLFAPPRTPLEQQRMRQAHRAAARALLPPAAQGPESWGWQGRTLSRRVGDRWLRVVSQLLAKPVSRLWDGAAAADAALPRAIPRPRLVDVMDWTARGHRYRAEVSELVPWPVLQRGGPVLEHEAGLPDVWWTELRGALTALAGISTGRIAVRQDWIDRNFPTYLGIPPVQITAWVTGHADLHWGNLSADHLVIFDWESWGRVPRGYDEGLLHAYSLATTPRTAARIRKEFAHVLDTTHGRIGELVALAQLLQVAGRGHHPELRGDLDLRAQHLTRQLAR